MITDAYDPCSEPIITPASFHGEKKELYSVAIGTFSREIYAEVLNMYPNEQIGQLSSVNWVRPIHTIEADGSVFVFYLSEIGSCMASEDVIEINHVTGAGHFILFGSAGALAPDVTSGKYVIPTSAYRDEGMSYHYAPPADYIRIKNADFVADVFSKNDLPHVCGKVWTTDALYMETRDKVQKRKSEGCIAVEMELAGVQAVCDHYGIELYHFLMTGDVVDQPDYAPEGLSEANHEMNNFFNALKIARSIS
ncbi:MAG: nucleoside phosphorylase [Oscillospiraceae bacterium]|nr:nucleoside phosphorylase [Oscillospiraceae bacterium]MBQ8978197.1 nucleoside phosphorylase [Oscillospiraceae bacterium]